RPAAGSPGGDATGQFAGEAFVADVETLADELVAVLIIVEHERHWTVGGDEPAEPAGECRAQRGGGRAGDVARGEGSRRTGVDHDTAAGEEPVDVVGAERLETRQLVVAAGAEPVELGQTAEIAGEGAEPGQQPVDELVLVGDGE